MLKKLFGNNSKRLTKTEYWRKWEFFELINDLEEAEKLLCSLKTDWSKESLKGFHEALVDEIDSIKEGNKNDLTQIYNWFLPTGLWDDFTNEKGNLLGNKIFEKASKWKKGNGEK